MDATTILKDAYGRTDAVAVEVIWQRLEERAQQRMHCAHVRPKVNTKEEDTYDRCSHRNI
jgi:hypothetical protein